MKVRLGANNGLSDGHLKGGEATQSMMGAALDLAARGRQVFPLVPNKKTPLIDRWPERATSDPTQITGWWTRWPDANIGVACGRGLLGLDVDVKGGRLGLRSFVELDLAIEAWGTFAVRTPSGGWHYYFHGPDVGNLIGRPGDGRLGDGLDIRSEGGYLVGPGSVIDDGQYVIVTDAPIQDAPAELIARLSAPRERCDDAGTPVVELDQPDAIRRAAAWLRDDAPLAVEGHGGDDRTFRVAAQLKDFGVSRTWAFLLMEEHWNERCSPPWDFGGLEKKINNAYDYGQNPPGAAHPATAFAGVDTEAFITSPGLSAPGRDRVVRSDLWAKPFAWADPTTLPARQWLYGRHLIRGYVTVTFAQGGVGKTTLTIAEALAVATGKPLLGVPPGERAPVWLWNGEDPADELQKRVQAAMILHAVAPEEVEGWLFIGSGRDADLVLAEQTREGAKVDDAVVEQMVTMILARGIVAVVIDPFVSSHRVQENDNGAIDRVAKTWGRIAERTGCAVHLVHHPRKTNGAETTAEDGRGASALLNAARHARTLNTMSKDEGVRLGVERSRLWSYVRIDDGKANLTPPAAKAEWFQLIGVALGNGDNIQVAVRWTPPDPFEDLTQADIRRIQDTVAAGQPGSCVGWRANVQAAGGWVGLAIATALCLDLDALGVRGRIKEILRELMRNGALKEERRRINEKGKDAPFAVVGQWIEADFPHFAKVGGGEVG